MLVKFTGEALSCSEAFYYAGKIPLDDTGILYLEKQQKRVYGCMTALESIPQKRDDYLKNKSIYDELTKLLNGEF
jgi:hypothetical protein